MPFRFSRRHGARVAVFEPRPRQPRGSSPACLLRTLAPMGPQRIVLLVGALLLVRRVADAGPITLAVGGGIRVQHTAKIDGEAHTDTRPAVAALIGVRLPIRSTFECALGFRFGYARMTLIERGIPSANNEPVLVTSRSSFDFAVTLPITSGRWWGTPWIGVMHSSEVERLYHVSAGDPPPASGGYVESDRTRRQLAGGVTVGYDLIDTRAGGLAITVDGEATSDYAAIGLGVAYHL